MHPALMARAEVAVIHDGRIFPCVFRQRIKNFTNIPQVLRLSGQTNCFPAFKAGGVKKLGIAQPNNQETVYGKIKSHVDFRHASRSD